MGIVKNRFGPRKHTTILNIDYPTLTLSESEEVDQESTQNRRMPNITDDIESSLSDGNSNIDVCSTLEKLNLLNGT
jgi:hypothetical protein